MSCIYTLTLNPSLDLFATTATVEPNKKIRCSELIKNPGGGGINASRVIHRLGGETTAVFPKGGYSGEELLELLREEEVNIIPVEASFDIRHSFSVYEESTARIFRFVPGGKEIQDSDLMSVLKQLEKRLSEGDYVLMSGSIPSGVGKKFLTDLKDSIHEKGALLVVDTSKDSLMWAVEAGVDILRVNDEEAASIKSIFYQRPELSDDELANLLLEKGSARIFICTRGDEGARWYDQKKTIIARPPKVKVLSSVGAGDSFVGGLLYGLSQNLEQSEALAIAAASATATVMTPGTELCQKDDVMRIREAVTIQIID